MSYKKVFPKTSVKTVDVLAAGGAFNVGCYVQNGKLVPATNSVTRLNSLKGKATAAWYIAVLKRYVLFTQNRIYHALGAFNNPATLEFEASKPSLVETRLNSIKVAYLIGDTNYYVLSSMYYYVPFKGNVHACVLKNGRIFGVDNTNPYKIKWSGEGGIEDWTEKISGAGWAVVQYVYGEILNLIVYKDTIVAVREYGLTFLSAYGTPENFKLSYLERKLPKICQNTVAVVGGKLLFYTEDGLYFYDGNKVEKCSLELAEEIESPTFVTCAKEKYYLCGVSKTLKRKAVLVYDAIRNTSYIIDAQVNALAVGDHIFAYSDTYECELTEGGEYAFTSGELDFSSKKVKVLKEVILDGTSDVEIEVSNGVISRIVRGVRGKFRPKMRGKSFKITVRGSEKINGVSAVAEVVDEV